MGGAREAWEHWLALWKSRPAAVSSSLTPETAIVRLANARYRGFVWPPEKWHKGRLRVVVGRVSPYGVRLTAKRTGRQNPWRPSLHGRFLRAPGGSAFVGHFTCYPFVKGFTALWLGGIASFAAFGVVVTIGAGAHGDWPVALEALAFTGGALGMAVAWVAVMIVAGRSGLRDEQALRWWLDRRLGRDL